MNEYEIITLWATVDVEGGFIDVAREKHQVEAWLAVTEEAVGITQGYGVLYKPTNLMPDEARDFHYKLEEAEEELRRFRLNLNLNLNLPGFLKRGKNMSTVYRLSKEMGKELQYGNNANWVENESEYECGVSVNPELVEVLKEMGLTLTPSYEEIKRQMEDSKTAYHSLVVLSNSEHSFVGTVWEGNLETNRGISTDLWINLDELTRKDIENEVKKMGLQLENEEWEMCINDSILTEYDNYVDGFPAISDGDFQFDRVRVFISLNKKTDKKEVLVYPWKNGETYTEDEGLISRTLKMEIEQMVKSLPFYQELKK